MNTLAEKVAVRLKSLMDSKGWTQQTIADATGLTYQTVNAFFNARGKVVNDSLVKIAEALGISLEDLFIEERLGELSKELEDKLFISFERTIARLTAKPEPSSPMLQAAELPPDERAALNAEMIALLAKLPIKGVRQSLMIVQGVVQNYAEGRASREKNERDSG